MLLVPLVGGVLPRLADSREREKNPMNATFYRLALPALLLATTPALLLAAPLKVGPAAGDTHCNVVTCPHCGQSMAVAQTSDYTINFSADSIHPKTGSARFSIGVTNPAG